MSRHKECTILVTSNNEIQKKDNTGTVHTFDHDSKVPILYITYRITTATVFWTVLVSLRVVSDYWETLKKCKWTLISQNRDISVFPEIVNILSQKVTCLCLYDCWQDSKLPKGFQRIDIKWPKNQKPKKKKIVTYFVFEPYRWIYG